ncbi:MAG: aldehyde ferredoxin oxidoreductase N-terminal domain-containing protein [Chloroflexota bacterium]
MIYGWVGRILEVNLTTGETSVLDTDKYESDYLGGRALAARLYWERSRSCNDPYDPANAVVVATGPLTGTLAPTAGRTVMGTMSPRPYPRPWYTHSTLGGWFGPTLKYAGFDAIVVRGAAETPVYLEVRDQDVRLRDAAGLWGMDAKTAQMEIRRRFDEQAQVLVIGPAGERLVRFATVQHAEENAAGHSGFGAVWGSKRLKGIAVVGTGGVPVADPAALLREVRGAGKFTITPMNGILREAHAVAKRRPVCSQACTFNCLISDYAISADGRRQPGHCIGNTWLGSSGMRLTRYSGGGIEIPAAVNFSPYEEARLHELCNSLGLDLWFRLVMQPWLIRCCQLGVTQIRSFPLQPEDGAWFESFMHQLAQREGLGGLFGEDLVRAMDELEGEIPEELIRLGRQMEFAFGFPAHREGRFWDEEPLPFWVISAMMYASESRDPTIGTHQSLMLMAGFLMRDPELARRQFAHLSKKVWGYSEALEPNFEGKAPVAMWTQHQHMLIDSLTLCDFAFPQLVRPIESEEAWKSSEDIAGDLEIGLRLARAVTGTDYGADGLALIAERAFNLERCLLALTGRGRKMEESLASHFSLPCRSDGTSIDAEGFARLLDEYYSMRGWDVHSGWPKPELLSSLGLVEALPEMSAHRSPNEFRGVG